MSLVEIEPTIAHQWMTERGYRYVDVRTKTEFTLGRPKGALNLVFRLEDQSLNPHFLSEFQAQFGKEERLILGCESGRRSSMAITALEALGYINLVNNKSGWGGKKDPFGRVTEPGWRALELPCEAG